MAHAHPQVSGPAASLVRLSGCQRTMRRALIVDVPESRVKAVAANPIVMAFRAMWVRLFGSCRSVQSGFACHQGRACPVGCADFSIEVLHVQFDCGFLNIQATGDFLVGLALGQPLEHLHFPP